VRPGAFVAFVVLESAQSVLFTVGFVRRFRRSETPVQTRLMPLTDVLQRCWTGVVRPVYRPSRWLRQAATARVRHPYYGPVRSVLYGHGAHPYPQDPDERKTKVARSPPARLSPPAPLKFPPPATLSNCLYLSCIIPFVFVYSI
jgi:hypothetical protein